MSHHKDSYLLIAGPDETEGKKLFQLISELYLSKNVFLIGTVENQEKIDFLAMRESIYALLIYNLDIYECMYSILSKLIVKGKLKDQHFEKILFKTYKFLKLYNNNYRPIYHLESFIFYVCIVINEL